MWILFPLGLGQVDFESATQAAEHAKSSTGKRKPYATCTDEDRYTMEKYTSTYGVAATLREYRQKFPRINESTLRSFKKRYECHLSKHDLRKISPTKKLINKKHGRPLMLGQLDKLAQSFMRATRYKGGVVSTTVALAAARTLVNRYPPDSI